MDGLGSASPPVAPTATTGEGRHPCTWPRTFWFKPLSAFGLLDLTTFISSSPELAMPSTLAPDRLSASSRRALSREARPPWVGEVTLSQELRTARLPWPHVLVGYQWSHTGLHPGRKTSHNRYIRSFVSHLPQIRACTSNAPGSSRCGIAVPHTTGWFRGDTRVRRDVLGVVPTPRPQRGTPFAPRGPEGPFPRFNTTMGRCDSLSSISPRFVSFAWRYHRSSPVRPHRLGTELWINLELVSRGSSRQSRWRRQGLPSSRETHLIIRHVPPTPV